MKIYVGRRTHSGVAVAWRESTRPGGMILPAATDLRNHSPDGFSWGYNGSGPAQLALALCVHVLDGNKERALRIYQAVKVAVIAPITEDNWQLTEIQLLQAIDEAEKGLTP